MMRALRTTLPLLVVVLGASSAFAQGLAPGQGPGGGSAPPAMMGHDRAMPHAGMHGGGMHHAMLGGPCPMMHEGMAGGAMGPPAGPKAQARMLRMRGDMMKAMGEVMLKHAEEMEKER
jgi:hypothetical protein